MLDACPDHQWQTIVVLARFGGLRTPSETLSVRWQDVNWERGRIVVESPKTEHHQGKETRTIPLFAELRPFLELAFELAPAGAVYVVDERFRKAALGPGGWANASLRTTFQKIIRRAGLQPWPRLFHNLRASRETELVERYSILSRPSEAMSARRKNRRRTAPHHVASSTPTKRKKPGFSGACRLLRHCENLFSIG